MPQSTPDESSLRRSVLQSLAERTGRSDKVVLSDLGSEHGATPVIDPSSVASRLVPQGRAKYQLVGEIARGGMGVILKGHDTDLGRDVAFKVLDQTLARNPAVVRRFVEEAQIGGQLQHPGIVPVYELGLMADESPYFTMKLIKGRTLAALFEQRKSPLDNRGRLLAIFESVCQTMAYAHSRSVLHRDLKPANVMVGAFGEVQVVDWGLAKVLHRGEAANEQRTESLHTVIETVRSSPGSAGPHSLAGSVMGTPAYMAPEQAQGEVDKLDERADVFSLGAILCEILTGAPPYVGIEGAVTLMQAAQADLDPARARIEACGADPALARLCLACLTPARGARPANADAVAKVMHEYIVSVETRAQEAELAAAEARVKVAEERRARRLTLALAGAITLALLLGGGGFWWVSRERAHRAEERWQRAEHTRSVVESAHDEVIELGQAGKPEEALGTARRALALAETGGADAALVARARNFVAKAESDLGAAEREREHLAQDEALRLRLVDLRLEQATPSRDLEPEIALDAAFAQAFRDYGVDLDGEDLVPALDRIREREIAVEVAQALDDWGRLRRRVHGAKSEKAENLELLALDLDPDPLRTRLRVAIANNDRAVLEELSRPENLHDLAPGSIFLLSSNLRGSGPVPAHDVLPILGSGLRLYPDDYSLQALTGEFYEGIGDHASAFICRNSAQSLRPRDVPTRLRAALSLFFLGRMAEARDAYEECIAMDPSNAEAWYQRALTQFALGDYEGELASLERSLELESDNLDCQPDLELARFYLGLSSRERIVGLLETERAPNRYVTYLYALVDHPDPKERDPELVLRTLAERASAIDNVGLTGNSPRDRIEAVARVGLADWQGALRVIEGRFQESAVMLLTPGAAVFLRSLIYSRVGRADAARVTFELGMREWNELTRGNPSAWERSDVMRWRRAAEAALAR